VPSQNGCRHTNDASAALLQSFRSRSQLFITLTASKIGAQDDRTKGCCSALCSAPPEERCAAAFPPLRHSPSSNPRAPPCAARPIQLHRRLQTCLAFLPSTRLMRKVLWLGMAALSCTRVVSLPNGQAAFKQKERVGEAPVPLWARGGRTGDLRARFFSKLKGRQLELAFMMMVIVSR